MASLSTPPPDDLRSDDPLVPGDALWEVLGQVPTPEPDGWLATKTLARWRREQAAAAPWWQGWLSPARLAGAGAAVALLIAAVVSTGLETDPAAGHVIAQTPVPAAPETTGMVADPKEVLSALEDAEWASWEFFWATSLEEVPEGSEALSATADEAAPLHQAMAYLAEGQSGDVLFGEADWH